MKATFRYIESNYRLNEKKSRTKTMDLPRKLFDHYDVDGMLKAFNGVVNGFTQSDSIVTVKTIKIGRREFQV